MDKIDLRYWTVAYRKIRANRFVRVDDVSVTWEEATILAARVAEVLGEGYQVWFTTTATYDREHFGEDSDNILVDSGRRVRVVEGGTLPEGGIEATRMVSDLTPGDEFRRNGYGPQVHRVVAIDPSESGLVRVTVADDGGPRFLWWFHGKKDVVTFVRHAAES